MKTYQGTYKVKNVAKYRGDVDNVVYRSGWEKQCFIWCDDNPNVKEWSSEEVVIPYYYEVDKKYHRYFTDLYIKYKDGKTVLVEVKPDKQTVPPTGNKNTKRYLQEGLTYVKNMNKWHAAEQVCKDNGWHFQIWTEHTLQQMGILPKPLGKPGSIKKLKPLAPYRKRKK